MVRSGVTSRRRVAVTVLGGLAGTILMSGVAFTHGSNVAVGVLAGALLIGALSFGVASGKMSAVTLCAVLMALFFAMIGPAVDDYRGSGVVPGASFGALLGWLFFGRRRAA